MMILWENLELMLKDFYSQKKLEICTFWVAKAKLAWAHSKTGIFLLMKLLVNISMGCRFLDLSLTAVTCLDILQCLCLALLSDSKSAQFFLVSPSVPTHNALTQRCWHANKSIFREGEVRKYRIKMLCWGTALIVKCKTFWNVAYIMLIFLVIGQGLIPPTLTPWWWT